MSEARGLTLRKVGPDDCELVLAWANDALTRRMSFNSAAIPKADHERWFAGKLRDENCLFYIVEREPAGAVGLVRFDAGEAGEAVISIVIAPTERGQGYSAEALRVACRAARSERPGLRVHAYIRPDNAASRGAFTSAGFSTRSDGEHAGQPALHMVSEV
jgi:RimJ/RimL family protein N-acetyltransferase